MRRKDTKEELIFLKLNVAEYLNRASITRGLYKYQEKIKLNN